MSSEFDTLQDYIVQCLLAEFSKNYDESNYHPEFMLRENNLKKYFQQILELTKNADFYQDYSPSVLSFLIIISLELHSDKSLYENSTLDGYSQALNGTFIEKYGITLEEVLKTDIFKTQEIFDNCLKYLHQKLTHSDFKKFPGVIDVYYNLLKNAEELKVTMIPTSVLPVSLILIDDYNTNNKLKGLQCCSSILKCLSSSDFTEGNYYEVIYRSIKKNVAEKDIEVTKVLLKCFLNVINIFPLHHKKTLLDDMFSMVLDELNIESNLYRKAECFLFVTNIISLHGINCVKKGIFKNVICDNLDVCTEDAVSEILLEPVIECLQMWIKHCWCIWRLSADQKLLSSLFKTLYISKGVDITTTQIQDLIVTLILLSSKEEQQQIKNELEIITKCSNPVFLKSIDTIISNIKP